MRKSHDYFFCQLTHDHQQTLFVDGHQSRNTTPTLTSCECTYNSYMRSLLQVCNSPSLLSFNTEMHVRSFIHVFLLIFIIQVYQCTRTPTTSIFYQPPSFSTHPHLFQPICICFRPTHLHVNALPVPAPTPPTNARLLPGMSPPFLTPHSPFSPPDALHAASNF